jgi:hypothetical protein
MRIGDTVGRWTLIYQGLNGIWLCRCQCLTIEAVPAEDLVTGASPSCGQCAEEKDNREDMIPHDENQAQKQQRPGAQTTPGHSCNSLAGIASPGVKSCDNRRLSPC